MNNYTFIDVPTRRTDHPNKRCTNYNCDTPMWRRQTYCRNTLSRKEEDKRNARKESSSRYKCMTSLCKIRNKQVS
ncbi:hypothetical protein ACOSQ4_017524 [Xanthoceras sorbifolium]